MARVRAAAILSLSIRFLLSRFTSPKLGEGGFLPFSFPPRNGAVSARARFSSCGVCDRFLMMPERA
jgi:hypothetical protein